MGLNNQQRLRRLAWRDHMEINEIQKLVTETAKVSNTGLKLLDRVFTPWMGGGRERKLNTSLQMVVLAFTVLILKRL